ncbi:MAG TPA: indolepyruvate ferredoxin oxidoreductase [Bacteroidetes bacterium]|nr:indolepyruvate ferredoxin oxidoreductase [Bacteroidota bacterium]
MKKLLLLGDEAIAQGAMDAGLSGIYAYPGTPSTEIMEYVQGSKMAEERNIHRMWSANEKTAFEAALGMSYGGKRAMVCMKHVGLNVAADPFMNSSVTGINGGFLLVSADDPSMHSSQNEQDSRYYGKFANIPILEPSNQQEAYDMAYEGFTLSEKYRVPVLLRITTRLAHSRSGVERREVLPQHSLSLPQDPKQFVLLPAMARVKYRILLSNQPNFREESLHSPFNKYFNGLDKRMGIIACGLAYNYLMENFRNGNIDYPVLKICQYPMPIELLKKITDECEEVLVVEEGYPFVEELIKGLLGKGVYVKGRLDGTLPRDGELDPDLVAEIFWKGKPLPHKTPDWISRRPPMLCKGCGHIDTFLALNEALKDYGPGHVFSDIGCYTLGANPPYNAIYSCVDMGASVTMAVGAADAGLFPSACVIGDSTFTHSGMTGLLDAVNKNSPVTVIISDNQTTAMTGGQPTPGLNRLEKICVGLGVEPEHMRVMVPLKKNHEENVKILREELEYRGVSVVISRRECIQTASKKKRAEKKTKKTNA